MSTTPTPPVAGPSAPAAAEVRAELERLLVSPAFVNAERLTRFLRFVTEEVLNSRGHLLKEYVVGVEVFDRPEGYDPRTDPIVRVEARRLRSKLQACYEADGYRSSVVIEFPKGSYSPVFHSRARLESTPEAGPPHRQFPRFHNRRALLTVAALAVIALLAAAAGWRQAFVWRAALAESHAASSEAALLWGPFLAPGSDSYVVFGSPLFFVSQRERAYIRAQGVNDASNLVNNPDFAGLQQRFEPLFGPLDGPRYDYALMGDALALERLSWFFGRAGRQLTALPAHAATWDRINDSNIVFLGAPRMNRLLQALPVRHDFEWGDGDGVVYNRNPQPGEERFYATRDHRESMSYAVIGRFPGLQQGRAILLLTAHSEPGVLAAVEQMTRPDSIRSMVARLKLRPGQPAYYEMLIRVMVDKGAPVKIEYITHHAVSTVTKKD